MSNHPIDQARIDKAREYSIKTAWERLRLPELPQGGGNISSPWRDDPGPSVQIGGERNIVFDHGTGEALDPIDLVRLVLECGFCEAVDWLLKDGANKSNVKKPQRSKRGDVKVLMPVPDDAPPPLTSHYKYGDVAGIWAYRDAGGRLLGYDCRFEKPDGLKIAVLPQTYCETPDGKRKWQWKSFPSPRPLYGLDRLADRPDAPVIWAEGCKAADAAGKLFPEYVAIASAGGAEAVGKTDYSPLKGRLLIVCPDADEPGRKAAGTVAQLAMDAGATDARIVQVPDDFPKGWDLADTPPSGFDVNKLRELVRGAVSVRGAAGSAGAGVNFVPREIVIRLDEKAMNDDALAALEVGDLTIFQRSGQLVTITREALPGGALVKADGSAVISPIAPAVLRERIAAVARFVQVGPKNQRIPKKVPEVTVRALSERGQYPGIRPLAGIVESPVLRPDGSILDQPGYDERTGLFLAKEMALSVPDNPSIADIKTAVNTLLDVVVDFPFAAPEHRSAWVAGLLTIVSRHAFDGPAPLILIDANTRGSGKTLLADISGIIATGLPMPRMVDAHNNDDETRKVITSMAIAGESLALIDNVAGVLGGPALDAALTAITWRGRQLGYSKMTPPLPLRVCWWATGNNVVLGADTSRRVEHVRLEARVERPEERSGFQHPDLRAWVKDERPRLLAAALTILRGFFVAGRPDQGLTPWGSFEAWSGLIRNTLVWAGLPDPAVAREALMESADREAGTLRTLLEGLRAVDPAGRGMTSGDLIAFADRGDSFAEAISELSMGAAGKPSPRTLGKRLEHLRGRVCGGFALERLPRSKKGTMWRAAGASNAYDASISTLRGENDDAGLNNLCIGAGNTCTNDTTCTGKVVEI